MVTGYWANFRKFVVSLLKAWYGDAATPGERLLLLLAPAVDDDYSQLPYFDRMSKGGVEGFFLFGQNPAGGARRRRTRRPPSRGTAQPRLAGGARLVRDGERGGLEGRPGGAPPPSDIKTEVFFIPAAAAPEKEGSLTNTQRLLQWHDKALNRWASGRSDAAFFYNFGKRQAALRGRPIRRDQPLLHLAWDSASINRHDCPTEARAGSRESRIWRRSCMEINGYQLDETAQRPARLVAALGAGGRRHEVVRVLDLQRRVPRAGAQSRQGAEAHVGDPITPSGASRGLTTVASSTIAPRRTPRDGRGRNARSWSGGTRSPPVGRRRTSRTSTPSCRRTIARRPTPRG